MPDIPDTEVTDAALTLRVTLRRLRRHRGLSQRDLVAPLHLSSHTAIVDYESGRRVPARDIIHGYEKFFDLATGSLQTLRDRALAQRAGAEAEAALAAHHGRRTATVIPHQLPAAIRHFVGRTADLAALDGVAAPAHRGKPHALASTAVIICSIDGVGGVGKTALAVHFARGIADRFPDGQLYLDLRGHSPHQPPLPADQALRTLMRAIGADAAGLPADADELANHYRTALAERRLLLILDNAATSEQVRPLLPGHPGCLAIVTSRHGLSGLVARDGAYRTILGTLHPDESLALLAHIIGTDRVAAEPVAAAAITRLCGHLPLALRIAAERATARTDVPLAILVDELSDETTILNRLVTDDETTNVRAVFSWSYRGLPPDEAAFFRRLALHPGIRFDMDAAAALGGITTAEAATLLAGLVAAHLVEADDAYYHLHDLVRAFALERLTEQDPPPARQEAVGRITSWYLHSAQSAARVLRPGRRHDALVPAPAGLSPRSFSEYAAALAWLDDEHANCTAATDAAHRHGLDTVAVAFPNALYDIFELRGLIPEWDATAGIGLASARRIGDPSTIAGILGSVAIIRRRTGDLEDAMTLINEALELRRSIGDRRGQASTLINLANVVRQIGRPAEALPLIEEAIALQRDFGSALGEAISIANLALIYGDLRRIPEMITVAQQAFALFRNLDDRPGQARAQSVIAYAYGELEEWQQSIEYSEIALDLSRACGLRDVEGAALRYLACAWFRLGERSRAEEHWERSLEIYDDIGDPVADEIRDERARMLADTPHGPNG